MQKISTILTGVLLVAVAVLFYLHFSSGKLGGKNSSVSGRSNSKDSFCAGKQVVAYVELDSLYTQVAFIKARRSELEMEQRNLSEQYNNEYNVLEAEKAKFIKRGNAVTQQEAQEFSDKYMQRQQEIESQKQANGQALAAKGAKVMDDMQIKLRDFLHEYNKDKKFTYILATGTGLDYLFYKDSSLNITPEIVKGLNEKIKPNGKP